MKHYTAEKLHELAAFNRRGMRAPNRRSAKRGYRRRERACLKRMTARMATEG